MGCTFHRQNFHLLLLMVCLPGIIICQVKIPDDLRNFLGVLEPYANQKNEVIFLLDESGSIGADVFPQVVRFTELMSRFFTVSYDYSRLAVITFATVPRTHVNYVRDGVGKNMCVFLPALKKIDYVGEWTHTGDAMVEAKKIFAHSRPDSNKIIMLLTDGRSNGGYDLPTISRELKSSGVIIFTVGVADVNEEELLTVASSEKHIYILTNFAYIQTFNDYLINDTKEDALDKVKDLSLCNNYCSAGSDCCDGNADCYCGPRSGHYECGCRPGFTGDGHKGKCVSCSKGTYKSEPGPGACIACPSNSTTSKVGSTSVTDCACIPGHEGDSAHGKPCKVVQCSKLEAPKGGVIIPSDCSNTYSSECTFKCHVGYCPYTCEKRSIGSTNESSLPWNLTPKESRHCLENGTWSGPDFYCEKVRCPALDFPQYGNHNCSDSDFTYDTVCHLTCNKGFLHSGSEYRTCLSNGSWSGEETKCSAQKCKPLKTNKILRIKPKFCSAEEVDYAMTCYYGCQEGYDLISRNKKGVSQPGTRKCLLGGKWSNEDENLFCEDAEKPTISCPKSVVVNTNPGLPTALVSWDQPEYHDNAAIVSVNVIHPKNASKPPTYFPIGSTKVVYEAVDSSNLKNTCSFTVTVIDKEPPQVMYCPSDIEVYHSERTSVDVTWKEPVFKDNSGNVSEAKPSRFGKFKWGPPSIVNYTVSDPSNNTATCSFSVKVKPYPCAYVEPPANGFLSCDKWTGGQLCQVSCRKGYAFPTPPDEMYFCSQKKLQWVKPLSRGGGKLVVFPWPDCGEIQPPSGINISASATYVVHNCSGVDTAYVRRKFIESFKGNLRIFCPKDKGCNTDNVNVTCKTASGRRKRNAYELYGSKFLEEEVHSLIRSRRQSDDNGLLVISFNVEVTPSENCTDDCEFPFEEDSFNTGDEDISTILQPALAQSVKDTYHIDNTSDSYFSYESVPVCKQGQVLENGTCVSCPSGTYFGAYAKKCIVCPTATYQDDEGSLSCKKCPNGYLTLHSRSKRPSDCRALCKPGSYSSTGLEPCTPCALSTYGTEWGAKYCVPCHNGLQTGFTGANSSEYCTYPCAVGSYSENGFPPCLLCPFGSYQPNQGETSCLKCPSGTTTVVEGAHSPQYCQTVHFCEHFRPCENGATCRDLENGYECVCPPGFASKNCETNVNDCSIDSCDNNATCVDLVDDFSCLCLPGFTGTLCEFNIDDCEPNPCENGGTCEDLVSNYTCHCLDGFMGVNCEINIDDCASDPCMNDGVCFDMQNDFRCCCPDGFTGHTCNIEVNACDGVNCLNGGKCISLRTSFNCSCPDGFEGERCELNIDECKSDPCLNGGTCIDGTNGTTCICPILYSGDYCEQSLVTEYLVKFPSPPLTSNYAKLINNQRLFAVTVSFFMQSNYVSDENRGTPVSYSYYNPEKDLVVDNAITLFDTKKLVLFLHGESFHTGYTGSSDTLWHHYAITWDSFNGSWAFYVDGHAQSSGSGVAVSEYMHPGIFVLGQEQDSLGGTFSIFEAFVGNITEFNVWDYAFTPEEVKKLSSKCGFFGNVIAWPSVQTHLEGSAVMDIFFSLCSSVGVCQSGDCSCRLNNESSEICKLAVTSCNPNPCSNDQECTEADNSSAICSCGTGFAGRFCQYDVNECLVNNGNCSHTCTNTVGSFYCSCPNGLILGNDNRSCIDISFCKNGKKVYLDQERWEDGCNECLCESGLIVCEPKTCPNVTCNDAEDLVFLPGHCCETCVRETSCIIDNSTVTTFDGLVYAFHGKCRYLLAKDYLDGTFSTYMEEADGGKTIAFHVMCTRVDVFPEGLVTVNGEVVPLPFHNKYIFINDSGSSITVWTYLGISLEWHSSESVFINVPDNFQKKTSGLCGNFNRKPKDDMTTRQHSFTERLLDFIQSWKTDTTCSEQKYPQLYLSQLQIAPIDLNHVMSLPGCLSSAKMTKAKRVCSALWRSRPFRPCHTLVDPTPYFYLCWRDACSCQGSSLCFCNSVLSYALECEKRGMTFRSLGKARICSKHCANNWVYQDCGPRCQAKCSANSTSDLSCMDWQCIPGCYCPENTVLHKGACIDRSKCPSE